MPTTTLTRQGWRSVALAMGLAAIALAMLTTPAEAATNRYVATTGSDIAAGGGPNDCTVFAAPCLTIQHAIDVSGPSDTIEVAAGEYTEALTIGVGQVGLVLRGAGNDLATGTIVQAHVDGPDAATGRTVLIQGPDASIASAPYVLEDLVIRHGNAEGDLGGGIQVTGSDTSLILDHVTVTENTALGGGGLASHEGTVTILDSLITQNRASGGGGGLLIEEGLLAVERSVVSENEAEDGGGILTFNTIDAELIDTTISGNTADADGDGDGDADADGDGDERGDGGGVWSNDGILVSRSTISGNTASDLGGGVYTDSTGHVLFVPNSTLSSNTAPDGAALYVESGSLAVMSTTITANSATGPGGGALGGAPAVSPSLTSTIVADQVTGVDCSLPASSSSNYNLWSDATCGVNFDTSLDNHNVQATDALLGPLADNGGPTYTHLPAPASPAIDAGYTTGCNTAEIGGVDQRGEARIVDPTSGGPGTCDIGAVELQPDDVPAALAVTTTSLTAGQVGTSYNETLAAMGGTPPYTWLLETGSSLPGSLSLAADGSITGTPSGPGTFNFTVQVTDDVGATDTQALTLTIVPAPLAITSVTLPDAQVGESYSEALAAVGGTGSYTWSLVSPSTLPANLSLSTAGVISGTPLDSAAATSTLFEVQVTDGAATDTQMFHLFVDPVLEIATTTLADGEVGVAYSEPFIVTGLPPLTPTVTGSLPDSVNLSLASGLMLGTPTVAGTFDFNVEVKDSFGGVASRDYTVTIHPAVEVTTTSVPDAQVGSAYSQTLATTGGVGPYTWWLTGTMPPNMGLNIATGEIWGTPTTPGTSNVTVTVTDALGGTDDQALTITVDPAPPPPSSDPFDDGEDELTDTGITLEVDDVDETEVAEGEETCAEASNERGAIQVCAPANVLPNGHTLVAGAVADLDALLEDAPAPEDAALLLGFIVQMQDADGDVVDDTFNEPLTLHLTVDGELVPDGASSVRLAYWDGEAWATILADVEERPDGTVDLTAEVDHLTIFGALEGAEACAPPLQPEPAASGVSLARWCGGSAETLPPAESYWVTVDGWFYSYSPSGLGFVNASFMALFPDGVIPEGTPLIVVR